MHGFNPIFPPQNTALPISQQIANLLEEIRHRQLRKHDVKENSGLVEHASLAFKHALLEVLLSPIDNASCHLSRQYRLQGLSSLAAMD